VADVRNLMIKCTPGRRMSAGTALSFAELGNRPVRVMDRVRFVHELPAARIQHKTTDLPYVASAPSHERRP
jgi:hypothetical protein